MTTIVGTGPGLPSLNTHPEHLLVEGVRGMGWGAMGGEVGGGGEGSPLKSP